MSIAETPRTMTVEDLLAMPDDGVERWLIRGQLRENPGNDMNRRNPDHSRIMANVAAILRNWMKLQPGPRGGVYAGDVHFKMRSDNLTGVGIDVAYVSPELRARTPKGRKVIEGVPVLAVEIFSPSDFHADVSEKIQEYLDVGVKVVWLIDPDFETVQVYSKNSEPQLFNRNQQLTAEPHLLGLVIAVAELFE